ncbi:hypothetical protein HYV21_00630 [Candidatus Microgenomates bacterium]|nr:hypothetical protein [Candidatus Microgenomates bacterium]
MGGKEIKERNQGVTLPRLTDGCKYSKGAIQLVEEAIERGIDPTHEVAQALTEVSINGKKTITRRHLGGLLEEVTRRMHSLPFINRI